MRPGRGDGFLTTADAAHLVGVQPATIRSWRNRGYLAAQGLDERNRPLHTREAVRAAERLVRENGLQASGIDPRQLRRAA
jgi:DNA-binding transcriptional MerR regulator